jgi:hypothetical protein
LAIFGRQFGLQPAATGQRLARLEDASLAGLEPLAQAADPRQARLDDAGAPPGSSRAEISLANILLLIPGDIVTIYMTGKGITPDTGDAKGAHTFIQLHWVLIAFVTCAIACFLFRLQATKPAGDGASWRDANWSLAFWTTVAFVLWAHAVSSVGPLIPGFAGGYAAFFAGLFGVFAPRLVRADSLAA